jgi:site-specific DNA-methyltransferase (adenine-specific)
MKKSNLIQGDAIEELRKLEEKSFNFIFADPPYFLSNDGFTVQSGKAVSVNKGDWDKSGGLEQEMEFHEKWIRECVRLLSKDGTIAISGTYHSIYKCGYILQKFGYRIINDITWFKPNGAPALAGRNFTASHETVLWASLGKTNKHTFNYALSRDWNAPNDLIYRRGKQMRSVWSIPTTPKREKAHGAHPTQKPLELMKRLVALCSKQGDRVLDPFCGSGTTGVACVLLGRDFTGIDLDQSYIQLTRKRMAKALEDYSQDF